MMSLTVVSLPQRYKRLLQAMTLAVAVVYMTLLLYQSAYGYPGLQVSATEDRCVGVATNCSSQARKLLSYAAHTLPHKLHPPNTPTPYATLLFAFA